MSDAYASTRRWAHHPVLHLGKVVATVAAAEIVIMWVIIPQMPAMSIYVEGVVDALLLSFIAGPLIWLGSVRPFQQVADQERSHADERHRSLSTELQRRGLERRLGDGLDVASNEAEVLDVTRAVLTEVCPSSAAVVMIADSSHSHFRQRVQVGEGDTCKVKSPNECPAVQRMRTLVFEANDPVVRCPFLRDVAVDAMCVPMSILGRSTGVIQRCRAPGGSPPDPNERRDLHVVSTQVGSRIGTLRALAEIRRQATTDGLTGVANRRVTREQIAALVEAGETLSVAMIDIDHFKRINDVHGHHTGDLALVAFCRVAQDVLGARGSIGRWGGEEFIVWTPLDLFEAMPVLEELRGRLNTLSEPGVPRFTATIGTTQHRKGETVDASLRRCDEALYRGKEQGRDRIVVV